MSIHIIAKEVEEAKHPYYVISYIVKKDESELMNSVARFIFSPSGNRVQFLEPDMKKMLKMGLDNELKQPLQEEIDQAIRRKAEEYIKNIDS